MTRSKQGLLGAGEWPQMQRLFPDVAGKRVLDLGCGYGWHCSYAAQQGAEAVVGIDQSESMLARAAEINAHPCITYHRCGITEYAYPAESFDAVISNLALHYIEDLDAVYRGVYTTLRQGCVFLMNIEHPTFTAGVEQKWCDCGHWPVDDYFYPGERKTAFLGREVKKYHHTLTQVVGGLLKAGFALEAVEEVMPPVAWRAQMPEEMRRPMMLILRAKKQDAI